MGHSFAELGWVPYKRLIRFNKSGPTQPLGDPFRRDALKKPKRLLPKYRAWSVE